ncbi:GAF and ANTAR domain-containing protein [Streptomyces sp. CRN 30]|uniref:ANTAR domain-containing protein n=1 Tax=Streptomyces sp. CRN 30 TaxID=3075613 RepID=UPI002A7FD9FD|nr:GAF and ANTAR domain-containing protein [Streptomyces sp. CRN 30]
MPTTDRELRIADAVLDLSRRTADFDPLELLHDLTAQACALLPVRSTGITVLEHRGDAERVTYATASDELCRQLVELQFDLGEGPCLESSRSRRPLPLVLLAGRGRDRWPRFAPYAREMGVTAVAAVSLRLPRMLLGALNLFMTGPPYVDLRDLRLTQSLADATAASFADRHDAADEAIVIGRLRTALDSRLVVEQAKGVLSARLDVDMDDAFAWLRAHARARHQNITVLATRIARGDTPDDLLPAR